MAKVIITPQDKRLFVENPKGFSFERNKQIIAETIKETTQFFLDLQNKVDDKLQNRIDMMSSYGVYRFNKGTKSFDDYVGKDLYRQVAGERILEKVKALKSSERLTGKFKGYALT